MHNRRQFQQAIATRGMRYFDMDRADAQVDLLGFLLQNSGAQLGRQFEAEVGLHRGQVKIIPLGYGLAGHHVHGRLAYEGSHVRTQKRLAQTVRIRNSPLAATFATLVGGSNTLLGVTLQFSVGANTNNIARIELFSTGGSLASVLNQTNATFSVPGANLGVGLHSFYAIVTAANGSQYRTETQWIRLVDTPPPFALSLVQPAPVLTWPATEEQIETAMA